MGQMLWNVPLNLKNSILEDLKGTWNISFLQASQLRLQKKLYLLKMPFTTVSKGQNDKKERIRNV